MLALATTREGDVPLYSQALGGNASDKVSLVAAVEALAVQLRAAAQKNESAADVPLFVADSGLYSADNMACLSAAAVRWISRVPDTSKEAHTAFEVLGGAWQHVDALYWAPVSVAPPGERGVVVRTGQGEERARATLQRQVEQVRQQWEQVLWHLGNRRFTCAPMPRQRWASSSSSAPSGWRCWPISSAIPGTASAAGPAKMPHQITKCGRSRPPWRSMRRQ